MATQVDIKKQLNYYKKKRNQFLFFIITPLLIPVLLYGFNFLFNFVNSNLLDTVILFLALIYIFYVTFLRSRLSIYSMYLNYYLILDDEVGVQALNAPFDLKRLGDSLKHKGYVIKRNETQYKVFYYEKLPQKSYFDKKDATILIILINSAKLDLYSEHLHNELNTLYNEIELKHKQVGHQVTLFVKETLDLSLETQADLQKIVNVQQGNRSLIQINIGLDTSQKKLYYLTPKKRYPNRMYYEAVQEIKRLIPLTEGSTHD